MEKLNPEKIKKDFPIFQSNPDLVFLDNAATSQVPRSVIDAEIEFEKTYRSNIHRGTYDMSRKASQKYEKARESMARFLGAERDEIVFTAGSTSSANMLAYMLEDYLDLKKGDTIFISQVEHHSNSLPFYELAKRNGCSLVHIAVTENLGLDYEKAAVLIREKIPKIVSVCLASNVLGTVNDIKKIAEVAHETGALMIADAAKAAGHIPIDVRELNCDFLFLSGHKMYGPTGIGVLYGKRDILEKLPPSFFGGGIVTQVTLESAEYKDSPYRFEAGTPNISGAIALAEAVHYIQDTGIEKIHRHTADLVSYAVSKLENIPGISIISEKNGEKNSGVVSMTVSGIPNEDLAEILNRRHIAVRTGYHCAQPLFQALQKEPVTRISFAMYNTHKDVDMLAQAIKEAQKTFHIIH